MRINLSKFIDYNTFSWNGSFVLIFSWNLATAQIRILAAIPRRLGDGMFTMNDAEAYWHDWQITKTLGGLARRYRDPRFGTGS